MAWVFPPPPLLLQVLHHFNLCPLVSLDCGAKMGECLLESRPEESGIAPPLVISDVRPLLVDLSTLKPPPNIEDLILEIWLIRGGPPKSRTGQRIRKIFYRSHGDLQLNLRTVDPGLDGLVGPPLIT